MPFTRKKRGFRPFRIMQFISKEIKWKEEKKLIGNSKIFKRQND
jgi:hypothetical protein